MDKHVSFTPADHHGHPVALDNGHHDSNYPSRLSDSHVDYPHRTHHISSPRRSYRASYVQPSQHYSHVPATSHYNTPSLHHSYTPVETHSTRRVRASHCEQPREVIVNTSPIRSYATHTEPSHVINNHHDSHMPVETVSYSHMPVETSHVRPTRVSYRRVEQPREVHNRSYVSNTHSYHPAPTQYSHTPTYSTHQHTPTHSTQYSHTPTYSTHRPHTPTYSTHPHTPTYSTHPHTSTPNVVIVPQPDNHHEPEPVSRKIADLPEVTVNSKKPKHPEVVVEGKKKTMRHNVPAPDHGKTNQGCCARTCGC